MSTNCASSVCPGATTAPCLIFILPGLFYIRIIPTDQEPMNSRPKIQVSSAWLSKIRGKTKWFFADKPAVGFQAACFSALGFIFMTMSLTFIAIDWTSGENRNIGGHWSAPPPPLLPRPYSPVLRPCSSPLDDENQPPAGRFWALVGLLSFIIRTIKSSNMLRGAQFCPVPPTQVDTYHQDPSQVVMDMMTSEAPQP